MVIIYVAKKEKLNMKNVLVLLLALSANSYCFSQKIVNLVLVGDDGVTENIKKAHSFIVIKKYPEGFKRLDYKRGAPLQRLRSFTDSTLTVLQGNYMEYWQNGYASISGYYLNNVKEKDWYYYNEEGKETLKEKYENGILISSLKLDTVKKETGKKDSLKPGEVEAIFKKGDAGWIKYLSKNLNSDVASQSVKGGTVVVRFVVNKNGECVNAHLDKSVEFVLDEEAIRVIEKSPLWHPANQDGRLVNAYRRQPITFVKQ
jgi:periplasmic protein TonB